ncbi:hypothetical protein [Streptomyces sp. NPDC059063]|uniref:hypothetical protein n=1 Tax=unclassified Streptomyces TaxID=2593676 RepID=UPI0036C5B587
MSVRPTVQAALALAAASCLALSAAPAQAAPPPPLPPDAAAVIAKWTGLSKTYAATAKYAYEPLAVQDGFARTDECAADPELGGMGYHYVNAKNIGSVDPAKPAALLYAPAKDGKRELVAVEWIVNDADGDKTTDDDRPSLFGVPFDGPMDGHFPGQPVHYDLHAWIYEENPTGVFSPWNPAVRCPKA